MVRTIQAHAALLPEAASADGISTAVLNIMGKVPRHEFVPKGIERPNDLKQHPRVLPGLWRELRKLKARSALAS
jgi:hypothetical protein